jgi:DNA-binding CsgD family transcriptional regulator
MFPGMMDSATEFFVSQGEVKIIQNSKVLPFCEISSATMQILDEAINNDKAAKLELFDMHPNSKMKRIEQFAKCRFGGLDFQGDLHDGVLQDGEYWECPNHGNCKSEGILCKLPTYNEQRLDKQEVKLLQLMSSNMTNEVIADELAMPLGSFHKLKKNVYDKLGIQTKQEGTMVSFFLNLIRV